MSAAASCPPEVLEWIAWYPDAGLSERQRGAVEAHAAGCAACREELAMVEGRAEPPAPASDPEAMLARLRARIEASGVQPSPLPVPAPPPVRRAAGVSWAAAAALALAVGVGGLLAGRQLAGPEPVLATASAPSAGASGPALELVFADGAPASRITELLRTLEGQVVAGPTPLGRYRVALSPGADAGAAARRLRSEEAELVLFAEPALP